MALRNIKPKSLDKAKARMGWVFVAPFLLGFVLLYLPMLWTSIRLTFVRTTIGVSGTIEKFSGFQNYSYALTEDSNFVQRFTESLTTMLFQIPAIVIFSLFIAIILNQKMPGRAVFRAIFFIPVIVSTGIIEAIDLENATLTSAMSSGSTIDMGGGTTTSAATEVISNLDVQRFFSGMQVGQGLVTYVTDLVNNVYDIINRSGVQMLIFLAGLQSISPAIYESAFMEGASSWETFWKITFPMISPMILVNAIYTVIESFTTESNRMMQYITELSVNGVQGVSGATEGVTTAMSWIYFLTVALIIGAVAGLFSAYVFYQRRD